MRVSYTWTADSGDRTTVTGGTRRAPRQNEASRSSSQAFRIVLTELRIKRDFLSFRQSLVLLSSGLRHDPVAHVGDPLEAPVPSQSPASQGFVITAPGSPGLPL